MLLFNRPNNAAIAAFIERQADAPFSYKETGATLNEPPANYVVDHNRCLLGNGPEAWDLSREAVRNWKMFDFPWIELCWPATPIATGRTVAIVVRHFGIWSLNAARIVYTIDETGDRERFGFAYGTLTEHAEMGEERFSVEFDRESGEVWYDLLAFSKPNHILAKLGYAAARRLQKQFAEDSKRAMLRAVRS